MDQESFFGDPREQSLVKATIVSKYFDAWAKVVIPYAKRFGMNIAYIDLFAGRGYYDDGTKSTPLLILEKAIANPDLREMLFTIFNDQNPNSVKSLDSAIKELPGIKMLKHAPITNNAVVGAELVNKLKSWSFPPSLFFVDPYGYKGLSLELINVAPRRFMWVS